MTVRFLSKAYSWTVIAAGGFLFVLSCVRIAADPFLWDWRLLLLLIATIVTSRFVILKLPKANAEISATDSIIFVTMLLFGGSEAVILATVGSVFQSARFNKKPSTLALSGAGMGCSTFLAWQTLALTFGSAPALARSGSATSFMGGICILALAQYFFNSGLVAVAVALKNRWGIWHTWTRYFLWTSIAYFASAVAAAATVKLVLAFGFYGVLLIAPVITSLYFTYRMYLRNVEVSLLQAEQAKMHVQELSRYVAELEAADAAVARSERDYRGLFENAHDAIIICRLDDHKVLNMNQRACEVYGFSREEFLGLSMNDLSLDTVYESHLGQLLKHSDDVKFESVQSRKDGSQLFLDTNASLVQYGDGPAILCINRDVTERRRLEEQLRQVQKMESIGTLAGGIAHDFNNLMTAVTGYATMLLKDFDEHDPVSDDLREIKRAADRAAGLTRQLLAFSRKQLLQPVILDLNRIIEDTSRMLERLIGENINLLTDLQEGLWPVEVDPGQIEQVLVNLVVNARDAMPGGGTLIITTRNVRSGNAYNSSIGLADDQYVMFSVVDSGTGMSDQVRERIFEPFFTTKEVGKGTGLGLSMVHGIMKQSGGEIEVLSYPDVGTTFNMYLPCSKQPVESSHDVNTWQDIPGDRCGTVLLVEDDPFVRGMTHRLLQRFGFNVIPANDPEHALSLIVKPDISIAVLLTDVIMPSLSGLDLGISSRALRPAMPIVFMSAYVQDEMIKKCTAIEGAAFLQKPFLPEELARALRVTWRSEYPELAIDPETIRLAQNSQIPI